MIKRAILFGGFVLLAGAAPAKASNELVQIAPTRAGRADAPTRHPLLGYLSHPKAPGRYPAVVVLHGCGGFSVFEVTGSDLLASWGYVALAPDSLGAANVCASGAGQGVTAEALDAYAALGYLAEQSFVDPDRVAILGYSMGGNGALTAVERGLMAEVFARHFRAAVVYYPKCNGYSGVMSVPTLILDGSRDDWAPAPACREMMARRGGQGAPLTLITYPGATHAFNVPLPARHYLGHLMEYDKAADEDALHRLRAFLQQTLGPPVARP